MTDSATQPPSAPGLLQDALGDLEHELASTRRVLEQLPDDRLDWKPHELSWSLGSLATHLANLVHWQVAMVRQDEFDLAATPPSSRALASRDEVLRSFDRGAEALREALRHTDDHALRQPWTLRRGDHVITRQPRTAVIRTVGISHLVHHRGQLTVYLRLLGLPVPGLYGPSADERAGA